MKQRDAYLRSKERAAIAAYLRALLGCRRLRLNAMGLHMTPEGEWLTLDGATFLEVHEDRSIIHSVAIEDAARMMRGGQGDARAARAGLPTTAT